MAAAPKCMEDGARGGSGTGGGDSQRGPRGAGCGGVHGACGRVSPARRGCVTRALTHRYLWVPPLYIATRTPHLLAWRGGDTHTHTHTRHPAPCPPTPPGARWPHASPENLSGAPGGSAVAVARCHLAGPRLAGPARTSRGLLEVLVNTVTHRCCSPAPVSPPRCSGPQCASPTAHPPPSARPGPPWHRLQGWGDAGRHPSPTVSPGAFKHHPLWNPAGGGWGH